ELRIVGQLERLNPVRFEPSRRPYLLHRRFRHSGGRGHGSAAPLGFAGRTVVQGQIHDLVDLLLRDRPLPTPALADLRELDQPSSANRARHPLTDAGDTDTARAIAVFARPSAAINNARARTTSRCGADGDRATDSSTSRCPED